MNAEGIELGQLGANARDPPVVDIEQQRPANFSQLTSNESVVSSIEEEDRQNLLA